VNGERRDFGRNRKENKMANISMDAINGIRYIMCDERLFGKEMRDRVNADFKSLISSLETKAAGKEDERWLVEDTDEDEDGRPCLIYIEERNRILVKWAGQNVMPCISSYDKMPDDAQEEFNSLFVA
jgi:hypothetical protein